MGVKRLSTTEPAVTSMELSLHAPGMSPMLRAGLGGLAASLRAIDRLPAKERPAGTWTVRQHSIVLDWEGVGAAEFLESLFKASFRISAEGVITLPGMFGKVPPPLEVRAAIQDAFRQTILQFGRSAKKATKIVAHSYEIDDRKYHVQVQPYAWFQQVDEWQDIAKQLVKPASKRRGISLAGWANPGAVQRHVAFGATKATYTPNEAICACFGIVGTLSFLTPDGGTLVIPEPSDLRAFAKARPKLTPSRIQETRMAGPGDAVLAMELSLRAAGLEERSAIERASAYSFRSTAWASQQKSRVQHIHTDAIQESALDVYAVCASSLPARVRVVAAKGKRPESSFTVASSLRGFVCDNLAGGLPWHHEFASARDRKDRDRFLHYRWASDNSGALRPDDVEGLRKMVERLEDAELVLVRSVHTALRKRFASIAEETRENPAARRNRWNRESERVRLAFSGAKTRDQVRFALADLWSRAGSIAELQDGWVAVLPLLDEARWRTARDLALVALASYKGRSKEEEINVGDGQDEENPS